MLVDVLQNALISSQPTRALSATYTRNYFTPQCTNTNGNAKVFSFVYFNAQMLHCLI